MSDTFRIKKLKLTRSTCLSEMDSLFQAANKGKIDPSAVNNFRVRCYDIDNIKETFVKAHQSICNFVLGQDDGEIEIENQIKESFFDQYYHIKAIHYELFENDTSNLSLLANAASATQNPSSSLRLPRLEIPLFKGDYKSFASYIDLFNALVHNTNIADIEKFKYLRSSLEGPPLTLIRTLPLVGTNYSIAYQSIIDRYSNQRLIAQSHWIAIENAPKLTMQNPKTLRLLLDTFSENVAALKNLDFPTEHWDFVLVMMLMRKLDADTITKFELEHGSTDAIPTYAKLESFLNKCCMAFDSINFSLSQKIGEKSFTKQGKVSTTPQRTASFSTTSKNAATQNTQPCILCKSFHSLYQCKNFIQKSPQERFSICRQSKLCINCLSHLHSTQRCKSNVNCRTCSRRHHSLLHFPNETQENVAQSPPKNAASTSTDETSSFVGAEFNNSKRGVLLATAVVNVLNNRGEYSPMRCLLDSGSMTSFISEKAASKLGLKQHFGRISISGVNSMSSVSQRGTIALKIKSLSDSPTTFCTDAVVLQKICERLPFEKIDTTTWNHIHNLKLADPAFNIPSNIDVLLAVDIFSQIMANDRIPSGSEEVPDAFKTAFGYIIMGKFLKPLTYAPHYSFFCNTDDQNLEHILTKFWEVESVPSITHHSPEDKACEEYFVQTVSRSPTGRYCVCLPFKNELPIFSGSRELAVTRFLSVERRLLKQPVLLDAYVKFMREYLDSGHMELIKNESVIPRHSCYIPHFCILRPDSITTPLRVVFNAAAKGLHHNSLNSELLSGPKLQQDIVEILLRFRVFKYVFSADIKQMYRMIMVDKSHCDYQRIIWRFSPDGPLQDYRLLTVVYGLSSSPFLALRTLHQLVHDEGHKYPLAANILLQNTFIDDIASGANSFEEAQTLQNHLIELLKLGGFELRKWSSNCEQLLEQFPQEFLATKPLTFDDSTAQCEPASKILGLQWTHRSDSFSFKIQVMDRKCTKRSILSELARVYDPLGILSPTIMFTKLLMKELWNAGVGWDDVPPPEIVRSWLHYKAEIPLLSKISFDRRLTADNAVTYDLIGFCDSSLKAYAAVVYLRITHSDGTMSTRIILSKAKVAPQKILTIPRLELCAAVLLAKLLEFVYNLVNSAIAFNNIIAFSDSQVALSWIRSSPHRWKTFVANRVAYIQEKVPPEKWRYVPTKFNPADLGTKGLLPSQIVDNKFWFDGPAFLLEADSIHFAYTPVDPENCADIEAKTISLSTQPTLPNLFENLLNNHSSFIAVQNILIQVLRFIDRSRRKIIVPDFISYAERKRALHLLVKYTQSVHFEHELMTKKFSKSLRKLNAFIDPDGLLRVGGRLTYATLSYEQKHPLLLPSKSRLTSLLIEHYHATYLHVGLRTLHFLLAQNFWILCPKRAINSILHKCLKCWRTHPKSFEPQMGNLPLARISQIKCFQKVGVDLGGPYFITLGRRRGIQTQKAFICVFICFATKAIHSELVVGLSTEAFLLALQRFIARRGRCTDIFSDCGTNFVGANRELHTLFSKAVNQEGITWHFNPPSGPHQGGLWERAIRSVKGHLATLIGQQILTYEEFNTLLILVESVLNSRPLTAMSSDIEDFNALTPAHFLTLEPVSSLPTPDFAEVPLNHLSRWQLLQKFHCDFWKRWRREYLHTLQQREKWLEPSSSPKIGTLVLIKCDNLPPSQWLLGRIISVFPGKDGQVRVAQVKTKNGSFLRPLVKLCPLPVSDN